MSKQTAVEWLVERIQSDKIFSFEKIIEQAKAMEREQVMNDYSAGLGYGTAHYIGEATDEEIDPANYYQRTYGKEATDANG